MKRHHLPAWLALLALLTHLLAMSTAGVPAAQHHGQADTGRAAHEHVHAQKTSAHTVAHAVAHGTDHDPASHSGHDHAGMLQCCCAGFTGLAALQFDPPRLPEGLVRQRFPLPEQPASLPLPREQWPALNPRASPLA